MLWERLDATVPPIGHSCETISRPTDMIPTLQHATKRMCAALPGLCVLGKPIVILSYVLRESCPVGEQ